METASRIRAIEGFERCLRWLQRCIAAFEKVEATFFSVHLYTSILLKHNELPTPTLEQILFRIML
jgi:hypothetical protein